MRDLCHNLTKKCNSAGSVLYFILCCGDYFGAFNIFIVLLLLYHSLLRVQNLQGGIKFCHLATVETLQTWKHLTVVLFSGMANLRCRLPQKEVGKWAGHPGGTNCVSWVPQRPGRFLSSGMDSKIKVC